MKQRWHPFFLLFIGFAAFGFLYQLIFHPVALLQSVLLFVLVIGIFYAIYQYVIRKQNGRSGGYYPRGKNNYNHLLSTFKRSAKQFGSKESVSLAKKKRKKEYPFKVIKGNKGKKDKSRPS
jgi:glucan phosphoethanolaminetransferase (alkaline phosphatase superfamily)